MGSRHHLYTGSDRERVNYRAASAPRTQPPPMCPEDPNHRSTQASCSHSSLVHTMNTGASFRWHLYSFSLFDLNLLGFSSIQIDRRTFKLCAFWERFVGELSRTLRVLWCTHMSSCLPVRLFSLQRIATKKGRTGRAGSAYLRQHLLCLSTAQKKKKRKKPPRNNSNPPNVLPETAQSVRSSAAEDAGVWKSRPRKKKTHRGEKKNPTNTPEMDER